MKDISTLLFAVIIVCTNYSFTAEPIEQGVGSSFLKGMDASAIYCQQAVTTFKLLILKAYKLTQI